MQNTSTDSFQATMTDTAFTYMLRCCDGSLYTGWTNDLAGRLKAHKSGKGCKYTRSHLPVNLVYYEKYESRREAMSREAQIKRLSKKEKEELLMHVPPDIDTYEKAAE
ncbi:MAG: GIY-YIG nuclease family protein [Eubacterium sp.]|nr:GIY-YIG nuclease family protein [Eubacterium sp.]